MYFPNFLTMAGAVSTNYLITLYRVHLAWAGFELTTLVVIGTDCTGSTSIKETIYMY
jgi:hypothetical protein